MSVDYSANIKIINLTEAFRYISFSQETQCTSNGKISRLMPFMKEYPFILKIV